MATLDRLTENHLARLSIHRTACCCTLPRYWRPAFTGVLVRARIKVDGNRKEAAPERGKRCAGKRLGTVAFMGIEKPAGL
jgi:hypothetical protein